MVPLYQSVISGMLIGLKGEIAGSLGVQLLQTNQPITKFSINHSHTASTAGRDTDVRLRIR